MSINLEQVTRLEVIRHDKCHKCFGNGMAPRGSMCKTCSGKGSVGRVIVFNDSSKKLEASLQDDNRTLKIFVTDRK